MDTLHCFPVGTCIFCGQNPAQLPSFGYCTICQQAGIPSNPGSKYSKCYKCKRFHAPSALVLNIHD